MRKLILIADDDAMHRQLLTDALQAVGHDTLTAEDGMRAIELARSVKPSLILMDVQMPVRDGISALKAMKTDPATLDIPIIAVSALAMDGDRDRMLQAGFDGYLGKPVSIKELRTEVNRHLEKSETQNGLRNETEDFDSGR